AIVIVTLGLEFPDLSEPAELLTALGLESAASVFSNAGAEDTDEMIWAMEARGGSSLVTRGFGKRGGGLGLKGRSKPGLPRRAGEMIGTVKCKGPFSGWECLRASFFSMLPLALKARGHC
uniref:Uncharacterized protein n=1 Tax=Pelodiscus sinensis TaxID=13735 RepID=K7EXX9_PELSI